MKATPNNESTIRSNMIDLTDEQNREILDEVYDKLLARWRQHALISEADYLAGVVAAMSVVSGSIKEDKVWAPGGLWVFSIMANESVVADELDRRGEPGLAKIARKREHQFMYRHKMLNQMADLAHTIYQNTPPTKVVEYDGMIEVLAWLRDKALHILENIDELPEAEMED